MHYYGEYQFALETIKLIFTIFFYDMNLFICR